MKFKSSFPFFLTERSGARMTEDAHWFYRLNSSKWITCIILLILLLVTLFALSAPKWNNMRLLYQEDLKHSAVEILANFDFEFIDQEATSVKKANFINSFPIYFRIDEEKNQQLQEHFLALTTAFAHGSTDSLKLTFGLNPSVLEKLKFYFSKGNFQEHFLLKVKQLLARGVIDEVMQGEYAPMRDCVIIQGERESPSRAIHAISNPKLASNVLSLLVLQPYQWGDDPLMVDGLAHIIEAVLLQTKGNLAIDLPSRNKALSQKVPIQGEVKEIVKKGEKIIERNQIVTERHLSMLNAYRDIYGKSQYTLEKPQRMIELGFAGLLMILLAYSYLLIIPNSIANKNGKLATFVVVLSFSMTINAFIALYGGPFLKNFNIPFYSYDLLPLALAPALATVILGVRIGVLCGIYVTIISAIQFENSFSLLLSGLFISFIMSYSIHRCHNYRNYFMKILFIVVGTALLLKFFEYLTTSQDFNFSVGTFAAMCINGVMTATFALLALFFMELIMGVTTDMSLQGLTATDSPLLYRLQLEANGTYLHSVSVAIIAEQAAIEIGASSIQTRVAALYHDIGKLSAPEYFAENANPNDNPYAKLSPSVSAIRIINHVKQGLDIAIRHHLPQIVRDAISQHHGTDLVSFFYTKALNEMDLRKGAIDRKIFSYPGPRPRQKEILIVSLADACEAATRSIDKPTHAKIDTMVSDIIRTKMRNGQLDQANITIAELSKIHASFVKTLTSQYHSRISYPKLSEDEDVYTVQSKTPPVA